MQSLGFPHIPVAKEPLPPKTHLPTHPSQAWGHAALPGRFLHALAAGCEELPTSPSLGSPL